MPVAIEAWSGVLSTSLALLCAILHLDLYTGCTGFKCTQRSVYYFIIPDVPDSIIVDTD